MAFAVYRAVQLGDICPGHRTRSGLVAGVLPGGERLEERPGRRDGAADMGEHRRHRRMVQPALCRHEVAVRLALDRHAKTTAVDNRRTNTFIESPSICRLFDLGEIMTEGD